MSNVTSEEKFEQLEKSNQIILGVANQYLESRQSQESSSNKEIENTITAITGEISKIINKEFTIAVVGEIKAGKSAFINALVGYDISHSRTKAATTYPVRIKHKKEHNKSSIKLDVSSVFWNHVKTVKNTLEREDFTNNVDLADFKSTLNYIKADNFTSENYNQDNLEIEEVRKLLEILHDLPRVSTIILPNLDIQNITKNVIPEISLEFPTIRLNADNQEGVILIDTPGLGEKGDVNPFIESTIETEIQNASAVMAVLEKGGRGSASEKQVADFMKKTSSSYVIAGKMDDYNRDGNDIPIDQLLKNIKNKYEKYNCKKVFAVAQLQAIQAIKVQDYFDKHDKTLEDPHTTDNFKKHPSYAILQKDYGKKEMKQIDSQADGYEELLHDEDFKDTILDILNPEEYPFTDITKEFKTLASNVLENILPSSTSKFIGNTEILKSNINETLIVFQGKAETAKNTLKLMTNIKTEIDKVSSNINNQIAKQESNITNFKSNLKEDTSSKLDDLIKLCKDNIDPDELKIDKPRVMQWIASWLGNRSKSDPTTDQKSAKDLILQACSELVDNMQDQAKKETKNITSELSKLSQGAKKQLAQINKNYKKTLKANYEEIKLPKLESYESEENSLIESDSVQNMITKNTDEKTETWEVSTSHWYNPFSWGSTETRSRTDIVFNENQFYADLKVKLSNVIDSMFIQIETNVAENILKITSIQEMLNNRINDMMSKLQDMEKHSHDIELSNRIKKEYAEFLNIINLHQELITKF